MVVTMHTHTSWPICVPCTPHSCTTVTHLCWNLQGIPSMPSVRKKRAQNKQYYLRNKQGIREVTRTKYWENPDKQRSACRASYWKNPGKRRASSRASYWRSLSPKGCLPGYPPIPAVGRTLSPKGHLPGRPPILVTERTLRKKGQLCGCPPVLVTDKKRAAVSMTNLKAARAKLKLV